MLQIERIHFDFLAALIFFAVGLAFVYVNLGIGALLRPHLPSKDKARIYECGEPTVGSAWVRYNIRFYTIALVFLVFDVETVFLFPVARVLRWFTQHGLGWVALLEILGFVAVLVVALAYAWRFGNLDWLRSHSEPSSEFSRSTSIGPTDADLERELELRELANRRL
ncbi:NADH-ubiquinone oxidoreductase chain A [Candidatus Sumerlaea chitinivorans]|uniref:NADH-quinone oxidoreductase subunit A n=1 Tax=Sumerlaea chitinivorans TaxID=2250252 RepID=A0A2Z4Y455_SUMC1|nr:NADH-ubiquinone oxidoreductase chain A [Candidatus Sumerlaea chitinivorans]